MPDASGRFIGTGWSQAREDAWTRIFGPAVGDDPDPDPDPDPDQDGECSGAAALPCVDSLVGDGCSCVPSEPSPEVPRDDEWDACDYGVDDFA